VLAFPAFVVLLFSSFAVAQTSLSPSVDVFAGYSFVSVDTNNLTAGRLSANGWEASTSINLWKYLAAESDFTGVYKPNVLGIGVNVSDYSFTGGPRFNFRQAFAHALFGLDRLTENGQGVSRWENSFAVALGGGAQVPLPAVRRLAIRASADYAITNHNIFAGPRVEQNNFRVGVGIVLLLGHRAGEVAPGEKHGNKPQNCGETLREPQQISLQQLGIQGDAAAIYGFRITAIARGSAADKAGLVVGDYIVSVNCVKVHTANELLTALSRVDGTAILAINKPTSLPDQTEIRRLEVGP
jgi:PDZ domain/Outer membrane protein beta-barrel domain